MLSRFAGTGTGGVAGVSPQAKPDRRMPKSTRISPPASAARKAKNFAEADRIRDALAAQGVILEDGPSGTTWRRE